MNKIVSLMALCLMSFSSHAALVILDFDDLENDPFVTEIFGSISEDGFMVSTTTPPPSGFADFAVVGDQTGNYTGSGALFSFNNTVSITSEQNADFGLLQFDVSYTDGLERDGILSVNATTTSGDTISQMFTLNNGQPGDLVSYILNSGFHGDVVEVNAACNRACQYDNFQVVNANPIPLPAAIWLFSAGLMSVLGFKRREIS